MENNYGKSPFIVDLPNLVYGKVSILILFIWLFNITMENGPFIVDLPMKNGGSFHSYVSLPKGTQFGKDSVVTWTQ